MIASVLLAAISSLAKEVSMYQQEYDEQKDITDALIASGSDDWAVRNAVSCISADALCRTLS